MDGIHVDNSYCIWSISKMRQIINNHTINPKEDIGRTYPGMYVEWYLHNIGYYVTLPFISNPKVAAINTRLKHVDLEAHNG